MGRMPNVLQTEVLTYVLTFVNLECSDHCYK